VKNKVVQTTSSPMQTLFSRLAALLMRGQDRYDLFDFRLGTIIGTLVVILIPIANQFITHKIIDYAPFRNALITIQLITVIASYYVTWIQRWANQIGNLFSLTYIIFIITFTAVYGFQVIDSVTMLIALYCTCGMFKEKTYLQWFIIIAYIVLILAVILVQNPVIDKAYLIAVSTVTLALSYYTVFTKIDAITKLTESQSIIRRNEELFRGIFDNAPLGIVLFNPDFKCIQCNRYFLNEVGFTEGDIQINGINYITHTEDRINPHIVQNTLNSNAGKAYEVEQRLKTTKGQTIWMRVTMANMNISNKEHYIIAMYDNISNEKITDLQLRESAKQLQAHNEALEEFSYVISHDLQEPLRMITSFSQLIERRHLPRLNDPNANQDFSYVIEGAKRMSTLIKDMLEYSRWSAKSLPFEFVDMKEVMDEVLQNLMVSISQANAQVVVEEMPNIYANKLLLRQVFQNLISNSIKYCHPERPAHIEIKVMKRQIDTLFVVKDNGLGFSDRDKERIFGIFQRLQTDRIGGNGMGLAICKRIIEKQGGKIWAESEPNVGSMFFFTLPTI
jgi:PAS domain S-box-containing protein